MLIRIMFCRTIDREDRLLKSDMGQKNLKDRGMDILQSWDIHMGISKMNGKNLFPACPKDNICKEYKDALSKHFGMKLFEAV